LERHITGKKILCLGSMPAIEMRTHIVDDPDHADVILINSEGISAQDTGNIVKNYKDTKRIICVGPSTAGIARLNQIELWCPFGTS
jgi:succinyl-CoA synthetase alpha subunit